MARVLGRIKFLIASIITINDIKATGVPWGTKWANIYLVLLINPKEIIPIHRGIEILIFVLICLVILKM